MDARGLTARLACEQAGQLKSELPGARKADEAREDLKNAQAELKATPDAPQSVDPQASAIAAWLPLSAEAIGRLLPLLPSMLLEFTPMGGMMLASTLWDLGSPRYASGERGSARAESSHKRAPSNKRRMTRDEALEALRSRVQTTPEGKFIIASGNALARKLVVNPSTFRGWVMHWRERGLVEVVKRETRRKIMAAANVA